MIAAYALNVDLEEICGDIVILDARFKPEEFWRRW